jgi:sugar transport system substrate-binding protein
MRSVIAVGMLVALLAGGGCQKSAPRTERPRIAGIVFQDDQFMRLVLCGLRKAAQQGGADFVQGCSYNKPDKEIELINTYAAQGVKAIVVTPVSARASIAALKLAADKGIKIITFNTRVDSDIPLAHVQCSDTSLGQQTGKAARKFIEETLGGQARVAVLAYRSQLPESSTARVDGFKAQVQDLPRVTFVAEQDGWLPEMALKKATDMLTAHPDLNVIFAANEGGCVGAALAVKNAGKAGKVGVFGIGSSEQIDGFILASDNIVQAVTDASPLEIGRIAGERALQAIRGQPAEKLTELPGVLVSRTDPESVRQFDAELKKAIRQTSERDGGR